VSAEDIAALTEEVQASMDEAIPKDTELDVYAPWAESVQYQVNGIPVDQYEYEMGISFLSQVKVAYLPYSQSIAIKQSLSFEWAYQCQVTLCV